MTYLHTEGEALSLEIKKVSDTLGIAGITQLVKTKTVNKNNFDRRSTNSFRIDKFIFDNYKDEVEFISAEMTNHFKDTFDWSSADISGQLNSKKNTGLLENRKPQTDEEIAAIGRGKSIWHATPKFYDVMTKELAMYQSQDEDKQLSLSKTKFDQIQDVTSGN